MIGCCVIFVRLSVLLAGSRIPGGNICSRHRVPELRRDGQNAKPPLQDAYFPPNVDPAIILFQCEGAVIHWLSVDWEVWENTSPSLFCSLLGARRREGGMGGWRGGGALLGCARLYADVVVKTEAPADDLTAAGSHWAGTQTAPPVAPRGKSTTAGAAVSGRRLRVTLVMRSCNGAALMRVHNDDVIDGDVSLTQDAKTLVNANISMSIHPAVYCSGLDAHVGDQGSSQLTQSGAMLRVEGDETPDGWG